MLIIGSDYKVSIASNSNLIYFHTSQAAASSGLHLLASRIISFAITGSFEFRDLFKIVNKLVYNNEVNFVFLTLCALLLFTGAVA